MNKNNTTFMCKLIIGVPIIFFVLISPLYINAHVYSIIRESNVERNMNWNSSDNHLVLDTATPPKVKKREKLLQTLPKLIYKVTNAEVFNVNYKNSKFQVVVVNSKYNTLKIISNGSGNMQGLEYHYKQNPNAKVLMNAGMFEADGSAVGLLISNNKLIKNINLKTNLPGNFYSMKNAIFYVDVNGKYYLNPTTVFNEKFKHKYQSILFATQSGPVLNIEGKINKEFNKNSVNKLIRNGIGIVSNKKNNIAIFVISKTPTTFYELASLFKYLGCDNAMYLDGTISSLFYKNNSNKKDKPQIGGMKLGPIFAIMPK